MTWFAFANDGHVYDLNGLAEKELVATFAHGYGTQAEAWAHKNAPANPAQAALLATFIAAASGPAGRAQGVIVINDVNAQGQTTGHVSAGSNPVTKGIASAAGDWISGLTKWIGQQNIWVRGAEIVVGMLVLYVGLKAVTAPPGANVGQRSAKQTARHVVKVAKKVVK